jgi:methylmalonyl-CoA mutase C-terminal domain/subunit
MRKRIRVVMAKLGLDGHDLGAKMIASFLRDSGMEVIYTGRHQTPDQVVAAVIQEGADVLGVSILSGAHLGLVKKLMNKMKDKEINDCLVIVGGLIPKVDRPVLKKMGVHAIFSGGTDIEDVVTFITENIQR